MKIGYFSDLHTEFLRPDIIVAGRRKSGHGSRREVGLETFAHHLGEAYAEADVIVAGGDIGKGVAAVHFLQIAFPDKPVIFVLGNHDYWGSEIYSTHRKIREATAGTNIHFLQAGETVQIDDVVFCGASLWTDYLLTDSQHNMSRAEARMNDFMHTTIAKQRSYSDAPFVMATAETLMNDFRRIRIRKGSSKIYKREEVPFRLRAADLLAQHHLHLKGIEAAMAAAYAEGKKLVVVSHHAPSARSLLYKSTPADMETYVYSQTDPFYASHLDYLMEQHDAPTAWLHGHTHLAVMYEVGTTLVCSNPKGYDNGDDTDWELGKMINI